VHGSAPSWDRLYELASGQEGYFTTRQPRGRRIRFVAFGDNSYGGVSDRAIAYQTYKQHPDFVMNCGDNVYESGTDAEYQRYFFPVYNADVAGPREGAPLLRSVLFYTVILVAVTALPFASRMSGLLYLASAVVLGALFLSYAVRIFVAYSDELAKKTFRYSIVYLSLLFAALLVDHYLRV